MHARKFTAYVVGLIVSSMAAGITAADQGLVPEGLSASDWSSIRAAYEANRHAAFVDKGVYVARNPGQAWRTRFDGRGFVTTPDAGGWSWGLELVSYGRGEQSRESQPAVAGEGAGQRCWVMEKALDRPVCIDANGRRVVYEWDENLTEWYLNDQRGLEHGFTVHRRPDEQRAAAFTPRGVDATRAEARGSGGLLRFTLAVRGDLIPRISGDGRNVAFVNDAGTAVVNYNGLTVFDATGAALPAWLECDDPHSAFPILHSQFLRIVIDDAEAVYPLTIDPIAQQAYLKASNSGADDEFGISVAVSGDTVVVGAPHEDSNAMGVNGDQADNSVSNSGAAYVFVRSGNVWTQQAYLKASNTDANDAFGYSVAVSGDTAVVGAPSEASNATGVNGPQGDNSAGGSGAVYVFIRSGGVWTQQAYMKASNTDAGDEFGVSVAVSGDTVVVGTWGEDSSATGVNGNQGDNSAAESGAAYVFVRNGIFWNQQAYLKASNTDADDLFGYSVAVSGDTVVVGAFQEDSNATGVNGNQADNNAADSGAAYVFFRSGGVWSQQAYLKASNTDANDAFGYSVAVSGDTAVVGAQGEGSNATGINGNQGDNSAGGAGAAYVYIRNGSVWTQQAYLKASNTEGADQFGTSAAISGDTLVVGAINEDSVAMGVNGNQADNSVLESGAAYVFFRSGGVWSQLAYIKASNTDPVDIFGGSVAVSGDTVVVGAINEDSSAVGVNGDQTDNTASNTGAAYVFAMDMDGDGVQDSLDGCPNDPAKTSPGQCGCGVAETDSDGDGTADCNDGCPNDVAKITPGVCGCGIPDTDLDNNGMTDCLEVPMMPSSCGACGPTASAAVMTLLGLWMMNRSTRRRRHL